MQKDCTDLRGRGSRRRKWGTADCQQHCATPALHGDGGEQSWDVARAALHHAGLVSGAERAAVIAWSPLSFHLSVALYHRITANKAQQPLEPQLYYNLAAKKHQSGHTTWVIAEHSSIPGHCRNNLATSFLAVLFLWAALLAGDTHRFGSAARSELPTWEEKLALSFCLEGFSIVPSSSGGCG